MSFIDNIRDKMNNNSSIATLVVVAILILAIASMVMYRMPASREPAQVWFYDTVTGDYFTDAATNVSPITSPAGNEAVRAMMYSCGECTEKLEKDGGKTFVGYYEKYSPETQKIIQENREVLMFARGPIKGRFFSEDGKTWEEDGSPKSQTIRQAARKKCKSGSLRSCLPPQPGKD